MIDNSWRDSSKLTNWQAYKRLLVYVKEMWLAFAVSVVGFCLYAISQAGFAGLMELLPAAFGEQSSNAITNGSWPSSVVNQSTEFYRLFLPIAVMIIVLVRGIGSYLGGYYMTLVARRVINRLRIQLFNHMLLLPGDFYSKNSSGHLISLITYNVEQITGAATDAITVIIREGMTVLMLFIYLAYLNWKLSLIFLAISPLIGLVVQLASRLFRRYSRRIQDSMGGVSHVTAEAIKGIQVVRAFGGREYEQDRFKAASEENLQHSLKLARVNEISTPVIQFIVFSAIALLFWFGLSPELKGEMNTGQFLAYITAASLVAKPLRQLTSVNSKIQKGIVAAQSIFAILDKQIERDTGTLAIERVRGDIEFKNLSFAYEQEDVLKGIDLKIKPGQTVALVGKSGAGKSTLVNLLLRFSEPPGASIFLDDKPIESYQLECLRKQIALVNQKVVLFEGSVASNIAYGDLAGYSREAIETAARAAHAMEFIEKLPKGLETAIGEDGVTLSGGQRQRLAIARALLKNAPILILDEATSALDNESEHFVQDALKTVMRGRTTLVIAHRLSTIENADVIVVLDHGGIVELGTHSELMASNSVYSMLHKKQFNV